MHEELAALITAAGGRTLALFTSWRAMDEAAAAVRAVVPYTILTQRDLPKPALVRAFAADDATCLFATAGLFQGVDVPGSTLSLVVIDRIPFPRPDDPLLSARRELLGRAAFGQIDLPRAAMLLAQACGRLIRTATDRGVVAVLDPRLSTARYGWDIVRALPPMRRTRHRADAEEFLRLLVPEAVAGLSTVASRWIASADQVVRLASTPGSRRSRSTPSTTATRCRANSWPSSVSGSTRSSRPRACVSSC